MRTLLLMLINRPPDEIVSLGEYRSNLSTPDIGVVTLPSECTQVSNLGIATSSRQLVKVFHPGE